MASEIFPKAKHLMQLSMDDALADANVIFTQFLCCAGHLKFPSATEWNGWEREAEVVL